MTCVYWLNQYCLYNNDLFTEKLNLKIVSKNTWMRHDGQVFLVKTYVLITTDSLSFLTFWCQNQWAWLCPWRTWWTSLSPPCTFYRYQDDPVYKKGNCQNKSPCCRQKVKIDWFDRFSWSLVLPMAFWLTRITADTDLFVILFHGQLNLSSLRSTIIQHSHF